jgi:hypothetical protein
VTRQNNNPGLKNEKNYFHKEANKQSWCLRLFFLFDIFSPAAARQILDPHSLGNKTSSVARITAVISSFNKKPKIKNISVIEIVKLCQRKMAGGIIATFRGNFSSVKKSSRCKDANLH